MPSSPGKFRRVHLVPVLALGASLAVLVLSGLRGGDPPRAPDPRPAGPSAAPEAVPAPPPPDHRAPPLDARVFRAGGEVLLLARRSDPGPAAARVPVEVRDAAGAVLREGRTDDGGVWRGAVPPVATEVLVGGPGGARLSLPSEPPASAEPPLLHPLTPAVPGMDLLVAALGLPDEATASAEAVLGDEREPLPVSEEATEGVPRSRGVVLRVAVPHDAPPGEMRLAAGGASVRTRIGRRFRRGGDAAEEPHRVAAPSVSGPPFGVSLREPPDEGAGPPEPAADGAWSIPLPPGPDPVAVLLFAVSGGRILGHASAEVRGDRALLRLPGDDDPAAHQEIVAVVAGSWGFLSEARAARRAGAAGGAPSLRIGLPETDAADAPADPEAPPPAVILVESHGPPGRALRLLAVTFRDPGSGRARALLLSHVPLVGLTLEEEERAGPLEVRAAAWWGPARVVSEAGAIEIPSRPGAAAPRRPDGAGAPEPPPHLRAILPGDGGRPVPLRGEAWASASAVAWEAVAPAEAEGSLRLWSGGSVVAEAWLAPAAGSRRGLLDPAEVSRGSLALEHGVPGLRALVVAATLDAPIAAADGLALRRGPLPRVRPGEPAEISLEVSAPAGVPPPEGPILVALPLPPGLLPDEDGWEVRARGPDGARVRLDGSGAVWSLPSLAPGATARLGLRVRPAGRSPAGPLALPAAWARGPLPLGALAWAPEVALPGE
jgi:hypothetical protein